MGSEDDAWQFTAGERVSPDDPIVHGNRWRRERDEAVEALIEYGDHQSWRCAHPPHWYLVDPSAVPDGDCPCGLLGTLARFGGQ